MDAKMSTAALPERSRGSRRRNHKACKRCRDQKIKCSGARPCEPCKRKGLPCNSDDQTEKVLVTRRYIDGLHDQLAALERKVRQSESPTTMTNRRFSSPQQVDEVGPSDARCRAFSQCQSTEGPQTKSEAPLINPLAFHATDWVPGPTGLPVFMGTSSNWAFGRRVLTMTYERLMEIPMPTDDLLFDGNVYDLEWNGERDFISQEPTLPSQNFALHLINAFKFHCGQLFHLMEEQYFMKQFHRFHEMPSGRFHVSTIWYIHYLLILAFGQAFVNQSTTVDRPPGRELFLHALRLMPDFSFFKADPIEKMQVLACVALYLQSIGYRSAAYQNIGRAMSIALEHGMHTEMQSHYMEESYVQRCRRAWWAVYILERRMASLLGVPMAIAEESISTPIPTIPGPPQISVALQLQVRFTQTLAVINQTMYGIEGQFDSRYLSATQSALRRIANITEQLNESFNIHPNGRTSSISRISAHLHLQQHHCVILTTRPLLYIFLESKLGHSEAIMMHWLRSETIHYLLQICIESAQQTIAILSHLLDQGLLVSLETFLPFDLDATFTATIALLMAAVIDPTLLPEHSPCSQRAYTILDEMDTRGNNIAGMTQLELKTLDNLLDRLSAECGSSTSQLSSEQDCSQVIDTCAAGDINTQSLEMNFSTEFRLYHGLDAEQLMHLADSLDLNSLTWPLPADEIPVQTM